MNDLPHFALTVGDLDEEENVFMTSLVSDPATDMKVQVFSKQEEKAPMKFAQMPSNGEYERIISGVWMMPDTKYYRVVNGFEFTVSFTKDELKKVLINYLKNDKADCFDIEHDGNLVADLVSIEHWVIESKETRSPVLGYSAADLGYNVNELPIGTIMKSVYIKNEQFFNDMILSGNVMGYSIEGLFNLTQIDEAMINTMQTEQFSKMFNELGLVQNEGTLMTKEGNLSFKKNEITINDVKVNDGEYKTTLGFNVVIREGKVIDFGFDNEVQTPAVDSAVPEQVVSQPEVVVADPIANTEVDTQVAQVVVEPTPVVEQPIVTPEVAAKDPIQERLDAIESRMSEKDAMISELQEKLATETKAKEELIKASPVPKSKVVAAEVDLTKFIVRRKDGVDYAIPIK